MRRNLEHVKILLDLIQTHANTSGLYMMDLLPIWEATSGNKDFLLREDECIYLVNLCADAGLLTITGGEQIQLTWAGHDYLDSFMRK